MKRLKRLFIGLIALFISFTTVPVYANTEFVKGEDYHATQVSWGVDTLGIATGSSVTLRNIGDLSPNADYETIVGEEQGHFVYNQGDNNFELTYDVKNNTVRVEMNDEVVVTSSNVTLYESVDLLKLSMRTKEGVAITFKELTLNGESITLNDASEVTTTWQDFIVSFPKLSEDVYTITGILHVDGQVSNTKSTTQITFSLGKTYDYYINSDEGNQYLTTEEFKSFEGSANYIKQIKTNTYVVKDGMQLETTLSEASDNATILVYPGDYNVIANNETMVEGQTGWYLPIVSDGISIIGVDAKGEFISDPTKTQARIYSTDYSANGSWSSQNLITVLGDNVTISGLTIMNKIAVNKSIEIKNDNTTITNCMFSPISQDLLSNVDSDVYSYANYKEYGSSVYFGGTSNNSEVTNNYFSYSGITFDGANDSSITIKNNTFNGVKKYIGEDQDYTYSTIGFTYWGDSSLTEQKTDISNSTFTIEYNAFVNAGAINFSKVSNGSVNVAKNYFGENLTADDVNALLIGDAVVADTYYTDASFTKVNCLVKHDVKHIAYVAPTVEKEGNIEYWYCPVCDQYFKDEALTILISKADTVINKLLVQTEIKDTEALKEEITNLEENQILDVVVTKPVEIDETSLEKLKENNNSLTITKMENDQVAYTWSFDTIVNTDKVFNANVIIDAPIKEIQEITENSLIISFEHEGVLPGTANVKLNVSSHYQAGDTLYFYYYNETTKQFEKIGDVYVVDEDGFVEVSIDHCSDYILQKELITNEEDSDVEEDTDTDVDANVDVDTDTKEEVDTSDNTNISLLCLMLGLSMLFSIVILKQKRA